MHVLLVIPVLNSVLVHWAFMWVHIDNSAGPELWCNWPGERPDYQLNADINDQTLYLILWREELTFYQENMFWLYTYRIRHQARISLQSSVIHTLWGRSAFKGGGAKSISIHSYQQAVGTCTWVYTHQHNPLLSLHPWEIQEAVPTPADVPEAQASCKHHEMLRLM